MAGSIAVRDATHVFMASPSFLIGGGNAQQLRLFDTTTFTQVASVTVPANLIPATSMFTNLVYLGGDAPDEDAYGAVRGRGFAVHVGRPGAESRAGAWMFDRGAAIDLLAQIAFAWSVRSPAR